MALTEEEIEQTRVLKDTYERRLGVRERQKARLGENAPPEIDLDIEDLRKKIKVATAILEPDPEDELSGLVKRRLEDDYFIFKAVVNAKEDVALLREDVIAIKEQQTAAQMWRLSVQDAIQSIPGLAADVAKETTGRVFGQWRNLLFIYCIAVFVLANGNYTIQGFFRAGIDVFVIAVLVAIVVRVGIWLRRKLT